MPPSTAPFDDPASTTRRHGPGGIGSAAAFAALIACELPRWREVVQAGHVKPDGP